ncbi:MAG: aldehyde dehydrogenase family protein [Bacillota bacterium]
MPEYHPPEFVGNFIDGKECRAVEKEEFPKFSPADGQVLFKVARSRAADVEMAVKASKRAQPSWEDTTVVYRSDILRAAALILRERKEEMARIVALETGKSFKDALGETGAAIEMGFFVAGEGRRFYGRTTTSAVQSKSVITVRQALGVAGLIVAANTPIANVAWKAFPALLCGNTAVLKAAEDTPLTALAFAKILNEAGLPAGAFNVIQGFGEEAGAPIVDSPNVDIVSFTGSCEVGRIIQQRAGARLAKVCLELGGKNPLVVCDDADLNLAVEAAVLAAFSNAGQRCASASRIIIFDSVYENFREMFVERTKQLKVGCSDEDDLGPVINQEQLDNMLKAVEKARAEGAVILTGGHRLSGPGYEGGFFMAPTIIENVALDAEISRTELFGPITCLYRVKDFEEALAMANDSPFGLTAAIHTKNINRMMRFVFKIKVGAAIVNGPTYGSEPHMPFGGLKNSGTGWREAGTEALDVYSDWKSISINFDPKAV